jgi:hypothetical protein
MTMSVAAAPRVMTTEELHALVEHIFVSEIRQVLPRGGCVLVFGEDTDAQGRQRPDGARTAFFPGKSACPKGMGRRSEASAPRRK